MKDCFILGVTGVIGSGKSTYCKFLQEHGGFTWINADEIVHELYQNGQAGYKKIREYFGNQFVGKREVHRGRLRRLVIGAQHKLWILNKLMHPLVAHQVNNKIVQLKKLAGSHKKPILICIEAAYFDPSDLGKFIDRLLMVDAPDEIIMKRLKARKIPNKQLKTLLKFQRKNMPKGARVIRNDNSLKMFFAKNRGYIQYL